MDRQNSTKALVESSILTSVAIVMILLSIYVPVFLLVGVFIWPIPITYIYAKHGMKLSVLSLVVTYVVAAITVDPITSFLMVILYGVLGVVLGYCIKSKKSVGFSLIIMAVCGFISTMIVLRVMVLVTGQDVISQGINSVNIMKESMRSAYIKSGTSKATIDKMMAFIPDPKIISTILPSLLITYSLVTAFICYFITQKILKRIKYLIPEIIPLSQWYIPSMVASGIIMIFIISFLLTFLKVENGQNYFLNANILFNFAFTINALGFVSFMLKKRKIQKYIRWVIIAICALTPISSILFYVGIFDYMLDFRKLDATRKKPIG